MWLSNVAFGCVRAFVNGTRFFGAHDSLAKVLGPFERTFSVLISLEHHSQSSLPPFQSSWHNLQHHELGKKRMSHFASPPCAPSRTETTLPTSPSVVRSSLSFVIPFTAVVEVKVLLCANHHSILPKICHGDTIELQGSNNPSDIFSLHGMSCVRFLQTLHFFHLL